MLAFELQLDDCKHEVMIAASLDSLERSCVCFVVARFEALGCQDEVYLVVNLPIRACQIAVLDNLWGRRGKGESVALRELQESPSSVVCVVVECQMFLL